MTAIHELDQDAHPRHPRPGAIARPTQPGARADEPTSGEDHGLSLTRIHDYVWARYVEFTPPPFEIQEDDALAFLHEHYQRHPIAEDTECSYYGILAFERFFAGDCRDRALRSTALRALSSYRDQTLNSYRDQTAPGFKWDAVEDRYQDLLDHR